MHPGIRPDPEPDAAQPALDLVLFLAFPGLPHHQVQRPLAEEELVSDPVHLLAAEIPQPDRHILGSIRMGQHDRLDLDAMRERTAFNKSFATKSSAQRCLPDITFTNQ